MSGKGEKGEEEEEEGLTANDRTVAERGGTHRQAQLKRLAIHQHAAMSP